MAGKAKCTSCHCPHFDLHESEMDHTGGLNHCLPAGERQWWNMIVGDSCPSFHSQWLQGLRLSLGQWLRDLAGAIVRVFQI